jgi:hypothetical protein
MEDNIKNFLDKVDQLKSDNLKVNVISKNSEIDCESLTFKQQKDIISTITEGITGPLKFQKNLNDIIVENTKDKELKVVDKLLIILQLRKDSVGTFVKLKNNKYDVLNDIIEKAKKLSPKLSKSIKGAISIDLEVPTLISESQVINSCIDSVKKDSEKEVGKSLSDIYTFEIVKYIKTVSIKDDVLNFQDLSVRDRVKIVNNLPLSVNKQIVDFIQDIKQAELDALSFDTESGESTLEIDVSFFDS